MTDEMRLLKVSKAILFTVPGVITSEESIEEIVAAGLIDFDTGAEMMSNEAMNLKGIKKNIKLPELENFSKKEDDQLPVLENNLVGQIKYPSKSEQYLAKIASAIANPLELTALKEAVDNVNSVMSKLYLNHKAEINTSLKRLISTSSTDTSKLSKIAEKAEAKNITVVKLDK